MMWYLIVKLMIDQVLELVKYKLHKKAGVDYLL